MLLQDRPVPVPAPVPVDDATPSRSGRAPLVALACAAFVVGGAVLDVPALVLLGLTAALAGALSGRLPRGLGLPFAVAALTLVAVVVGGLGAVLGAPLLDSGVVLAVVAACCLAACACSQVASPRLRVVDVLPQVPALLALAVSAAQVADVHRVLGWSSRGTDFTEHTVLLGQLRATGWLSYDVEAYPRAVHALLVLASSATAPAQGSGALLVHDLQLMGWATWAALALLLSVGAGIVRTTAATAGAADLSGALIALVAGLGALQWWPFMSVFMSMAAAPGVVTVVVLLLLPLVTWAPAVRDVRVVTGVTALTTVLLAHLWPALLPLAGLAWLAVVWSRDQRGALLAALRRPAQALLALPVAVVVLLLTGQPLAGLFGHGGLAIAGIDGGLPPAPWVVLVLAAVGAPLATRLPRAGTAPRALLGTVAGLATALALLAANVQPRWDLTQYYPNKAAWLGAVALAPWLVGPLALPAGRLVARLRLLVRGRGLVPRTLLVAVPVAVFVALVLPVLVVNGNPAWHASRLAAELDQRRLHAALTYPDTLAPSVVVPVGFGLRVSEQHDGYLLAKMLRHRTGQPQTFGRLQDACGAVREVAGSRPAVVLTDLTPDDVRQVLSRQGCADVPVVQVPGADPDAVRFARLGAGLVGNAGPTEN